MIDPETIAKCSICHQTPDIKCNWNQGRCPHIPAVTYYPKCLLLLLAPVIISLWCLTNPRKVWEQAMKEWNIK
jgi:hypothetical protein